MLMLLVACLGPRDGTAVGNPGNAGIIAQEGEDSRVHWGQAKVHAKAAAGDHELGQVGGFLGYDINMLRGSESFIELAPGRYDGLYLYIQSLKLRGVSDQGVEIELDLEPSRLCVEGDFRVKTDDRLLLLFPLDRVIDVDALHEAGLERLVIDQDSQGSTQIAMDLETLPELWRDLDQDGQVGPGDRLVETNWRL